MMATTDEYHLREALRIIEALLRKQYSLDAVTLASIDRLKTHVEAIRVKGDAEREKRAAAEE